MKEHTWEDVVKECEDMLQMNGHAESPLMSNLPNVIRDLLYKLHGSPTASQPSDAADQRINCSKCGHEQDRVLYCQKCGHIWPLI